MILGYFAILEVKFRFLLLPTSNVIEIGVLIFVSLWAVRLLNIKEKEEINISISCLSVEATENWDYLLSLKVEILFCDIL